MSRSAAQHHRASRTAALRSIQQIRLPQFIKPNRHRLPFGENRFGAFAGFEAAAPLQIFRALVELDATDIGRWMCEGDDSGARSQHPDLRCRLTKTLMAGDDHCNHVFHVEEQG